jgi:hypothetical protein
VKDTRLLALLLLPSPLSLILSALLTALVLLGANWSYLQAQPFFATYLSGEYGFGSLLSKFNATLGNALNSDLAYNGAVICFAILFGLGVYALAISFRHVVLEAQATLDKVEYADQRAKRTLERSLGLRIGVRALSTLVWFGYALFFFNGLLPYCVTLVTGGVQEQIILVALRNVLAGVLLLLTIHVHVIFVRLIALRSRLFGVSGNVGQGGH